MALQGYFEAVVYRCKNDETLYQFTQISYRSDLDNWESDADRARSGVQNLWGTLVFRVCTFCLDKKKKALDLEIFIPTHGTLKKVKWIQNTIVNASVLVIFWW